LHYSTFAFSSWEYLTLRYATWSLIKISAYYLYVCSVTNETLTTKCLYFLLRNTLLTEQQNASARPSFNQKATLFTRKGESFSSTTVTSPFQTLTSKSSRLNFKPFAWGSSAVWTGLSFQESFLYLLCKKLQPVEKFYTGTMRT
jgi:hypothetical protein